MRKVIFILCLFIGTSLFSQEININFEDSDLSEWEESTSDRWHIDNNSPINGSGSLHHNYDSDAPATNMISYNHTQLHLDSAATTWQFSVRYGYTPSSGNNWAFWLTSSTKSNEMYPSGSSEGYVVGVNYTGSDDTVKLWRQEGYAVTEIIVSDINWQESIQVGESVDFRISRSMQGEWTLQIDTTTKGNFFTIGETVDTLHTKSEYLGVFYEYSSAQDRKLWLDDILINGFFKADVAPPFISSYSVLEQNELLLSFNKEIDTNASILYVLNRQHNPLTINWTNASSVVLLFEFAFEAENLLEIYSLTDSKGNVSQIESLNFNYYSPEKFDVIISEIMADPSPSIDLPECEYVELYNRSEKLLNLKGWSFNSGTRDPIFFDENNLKPKEYILLIDEDFEEKFNEEFSDSIKIITFSALPSLPNSGETLILRNKYGDEIHKVNYADSWHTDESKEDGGWSLEIVDTDYPCVVTNNWQLSMSEYGGTPGYQNSGTGFLENYPTANLTGISDISENSCVLGFTETLDSASASKTSNYKLTNSEIFVSLATPLSPNFKEIELVFSESLPTGEAYNLSVDVDLHDCSGVGVFAEPIVFGVPQIPDSANILISEVLFDETSFVPEFVELYNNSEKVIDLSEIKLASVDQFADTVKSANSIIRSSYHFFPNTYVVLTANKALLQETFSDLSHSKVIELESWSKLNNNGGKIGLVNEALSILELAVFSPKMHFALLENKSGVSLERISVFQPGTNTKNWHSAATSVDYATPGTENSQSYTSDNISSLILIDPKEFSPDNDGWNDFQNIHYNFPQGGYAASVKIYTQRGLLVNNLVNNELCGPSGSFVWDGLDENSGRLAMGYYIIYFEAWHPNGDVIKEKLISLLLPEKK